MTSGPLLVRRSCPLKRADSDQMTLVRLDHRLEPGVHAEAAEDRPDVERTLERLDEDLAWTLLLPGARREGGLVGFAGAVGRSIELASM